MITAFVTGVAAGRIWIGSGTRITAGPVPLNQGEMLLKPVEGFPQGVGVHSQRLGPHLIQLRRPQLGWHSLAGSRQQPAVGWAKVEVGKAAVIAIATTAHGMFPRTRSLSVVALFSPAPLTGWERSARHQEAILRPCFLLLRC